MSETEVTAAAPVSSARTAGSLLRQARQAQGMHIAVLAASMKVAQKKLEALENDRFEELPDATFTRALAQTVCRTLKIDPAPVLALLPLQPVDRRLEHVSQGINAPFHETSGRHEPQTSAALRSPFVMGAGLLLLGALAVYFVPQGWLGGGSPSAVAVPEAASRPIAPANAASEPSVLLVPVAPEVAEAASAAAPGASAASALGGPRE